jgi:hypothetical protein
MRRRLPTPKAYSSCRPFASLTHSGRAMGEAVSLRPAFAASQPANAYFRPHDVNKASHILVSTRRSICEYMRIFLQLTLRLQMSSLTFGSAGEAAVTRQPKRASATTTKTSSTPHHHTPRTATKQHDKLHRMTAKLLWYVFRRLVGAQQRILTWSCRFARFAFTARVRPPASGMSHLPPTHTQHTSMRFRLEYISSARPRRCFGYVVDLSTPCLEIFTDTMRQRLPRRLASAFHVGNHQHHNTRSPTVSDSRH